MINKAILVGHVGQDPEVKHIDSGDAVCSFSLATSEKWNTKDGEKKERTEWHNITLWRRQAEVAGEYLRKGSKVYIEGSIRYEKYQDKDGNDKYATKIVGQRMIFLDSKGSKKQDNTPLTDDDLPF